MAFAVTPADHRQLGVPGRALRGLPPGPAGRRDVGQMFISFLPGTTSAELVFPPGKVIMDDGGC